MCQISLKPMVKHIFRQGGFTLIELLTVMVVIAILARIVSVSVVGTGQAGKEAPPRVPDLSRRGCLCGKVLNLTQMILG